MLVFFVSFFLFLFFVFLFVRCLFIIFPWTHLYRQQRLKNGNNTIHEILTDHIIHVVVNSEDFSAEREIDKEREIERERERERERGREGGDKLKENQYSIGVTRQ